MKPPGCPAHGRGDHSLLLKTKSGLGRPWDSGGLRWEPNSAMLQPAQCSRGGEPSWWDPPPPVLTPIAAPCVFIHLRHSIST